MADIDPGDRAHCEELTCRPGGLFLLVHRFIRSPAADRVLASEAFFRSVRSIPENVSDAAVAKAKLSWWMNELSRARQSGTQHPVIRALLASGALADLEAAGWQAYVEHIFGRVESDAPADLSELEHRLRRTGGHEAQMMAGLREDHPLTAAVQSLGMASQLLRNCAGMAQNGGRPGWWPQELEARFDVENNQHALHGALEFLCGLALEYQRRADPDRLQLTASADSGPGAAFVMLRAGAEKHRLERMK